MKRKRSPLRNRKIIAGVTGSVAAYKAVELVRRLRDEEAEVTVMMTPASLNFITPLSLELASGRKPVTDMFAEPLSHVKVPQEAELFLIAPATASTIGKLATGLAGCPISASYLVFRGKTLIAPAMNENMYLHPAFRKNLEYLKSLGVAEVAPEAGPLACGAEGVGRMAPVEDILEAARRALTGKDLSGLKVLVTAGPTREPLDPVRFISNRSSGKMGYALAAEAAARGADVTLVTGPVSIAPPTGVDLVRVETTGRMREAAVESARAADIAVMAAAPADFSPAAFSDEKIEKKDALELRFQLAPDILAELGRMRPRPFLAGFAAETGPSLARAEKKLREKGADLMVVNDVTCEGAGFDVDTNRVTLLAANGSREELPLMHKRDLAGVIFDRILALKSL